MDWGIGGGMDAHLGMRRVPDEGRHASCDGDAH